MYSRIATRDRGLVRKGNDGTFEARARDFAAYLLALKFDDITVKQIRCRLGSLDDHSLDRRHSRWKTGVPTSKQDFKAATLARYVSSAETWCLVKLGFHPNTRQQHNGIATAITQIIRDRRCWQQEREKIAALPYEFYRHFITWYRKRELATSQACTQQCLIGIDWACSGPTRRRILANKRNGYNRKQSAGKW